VVSRDTIKYLGRLSRLELTEEEVAKYESQIEEIIKYLDKLDSVSLSEIEPIHQEKNFCELREDNTKAFEHNTLESVRNRKDDFVKGPRIL
jgi:aspartyl-tRNA(Asn)/glutamyl-tRNA(Gln) amidotransferase subunit C